MAEENAEKMMKLLGTIAQMKTTKPKTVVTTPDFKEFYVKHALAMQTPEDLRLMLSNFQNVTELHNNVSLWMSWKFAKQLGTFLLLKVSEHEKQFGKIQFDDEISFNNMLRVIESINEVDVDEMKEKFEERQKENVTIHFKCTNDQCEVDNEIIINKSDMPKDEEQMIVFPCQYCGTKIEMKLGQNKKTKRKKKKK